MVHMRVVWDDDMTDEDSNDLTPEPPKRREAAQDELAEAPDGPIAEMDAEDEGAGSSEETDGTGETALNAAILESLLFSTHHPLTAGRLAELLETKGTKEVRRAIKDLNKGYESAGRAFRIEQVAGGYQMLTLPEYGDVIKKLHQKEQDAKLGKAALETLAIIAYKQPILRAELESIRGVACGETIRSLMEKHLVKIGGRAELPGRPILYGTTKRFLELFGLNTLKDLPPAEEDLKPKG